MSKVRKCIAVASLATSAMLGTAGYTFLSGGDSSAAFPPPGQCKNLNGNCNGNSENAPPKCDDLPAGQQKKCA
jgi:hypothetical protein